MSLSSKRSSPASWLDQQRFLLSFVLLNAAAGLTVGVAKVATSLYAVDLQATAAQLSLIAGAQSFGVLLMSLPVGILVDRHGPLRLFGFGSVCAGVLYLFLPLVHSAVFLAVVITIASLFLPMRFVSISAVLMQELERVGPARAGWFRGSSLIGFLLLGPMLAVASLKLLGFTGTYWFVAAGFFATAWAARYVMSGVHAQPSPQHTTGEQGGWRQLRAQLSLLRHDADLRSTGIVEFTGQAVNQYYSFFIIVIAIHQYRFSPADAAMLVSAQGGSYVFSLFALGGLMYRLGQVRFFRVSQVLAAAALLLLAWTQWSAGLWAGALLLGLGLGMQQTVNITRFALIGARAGRGRVAGINAFVGPAGGLVGGMLGGWAGHYLGLQTVFALFVPVFLWWSVMAGRRAQPQASGPDAFPAVPIRTTTPP